jgi:hypothetical protein
MDVASLLKDFQVIRTPLRLASGAKEMPFIVRWDNPDWWQRACIPDDGGVVEETAKTRKGRRA